jgi:hypothetical protein
MATYDLRVFHPLSTGPQARLAVAFADADDRTMACSGLERLCQQVLLLLLTARGTKRFAPSYGTRFVSDGQRGAWRTTADVARSFAAAVLDVKRQLRAAELEDTPDDERVDEVTLERVSVDRDQVAIGISVTARSGATTSFVAPVRLVPKA